MFGLWRLILAIFVVFYHMVKVPLIGTLAVYAFFVLSGFLMTLIMHESYGYTKTGIRNFALNRFLRLYPMYWMILFLSIILIIIVGAEFAYNYHETQQLPSNISEVFTNISMIFPALNPSSWEVRLAPASWALTIELFFYACIAFGLSKSRMITILWCFLSLVYCGLTYIYPWERYASILAGSLPFSLGALTYHYRHQLFSLVKSLGVSSPLLALFLYSFLAISFTLDRLLLGDDYVLRGAFYMNLILSVYVTVTLYFNGKTLMSRKWDTFWGDFSYPIYLMHWQVGLLVTYFLYSAPMKGWNMEGFIVLFVALPVMFFISYILTQLIDKNISVVRKRLRESTSS